VIEALAVAVDSLAVEVVTLDGARSETRIFLHAASERHLGPETLAERIDGRASQFLPCEVGGHLELVNLEHVAYIGCPPDLPELASLDELASFRAGATLELASGERLARRAPLSAPGGEQPHLRPPQLRRAVPAAHHGRPQLLRQPQRHRAGSNGGLPMPVIDQLLQVMHDRGGAQGALVLEPGREARLRSGTAERALTRSPLDAATIQGLLREVAPGPVNGGNGATDRIEFRYPLGRLEFLVSAVGSPTGWSVSARTSEPSSAPGGAAVIAPPAARPGRPQPGTDDNRQNAAPAVVVNGSGGAAAPGTTGTTANSASPTQPSIAAAAPVPPAAAGPALAEPALVATAGPVDADLHVLPAISRLLADLVTAKGSDLHLGAQQAPRWRVDGDLKVIAGFAPPTPEQLKELLWAITPERNRVEFEARNDTDFAYELPGNGRFRVNLFRDRLGAGAVMRQIPEKIPTADELGLSEAVRNLAHLSKGLVLVTGPTGSGKSTTLAAMIDLINRTRRPHHHHRGPGRVRAPVEASCLVHQREVARAHRLVQAGAAAALREDPDVVLVGEMRDLETMAIAIETAETGHLVFGTLHTTTAISTVERLVDQFPGDRQAADPNDAGRFSLKAVIAQTLLKKVGGGRVAAQEILLGSRRRSRT
jgi:twitching motility protein PilT